MKNVLLTLSAATLIGGLGSMAQAQDATTMPQQTAPVPTDPMAPNNPLEPTDPTAPTDPLDPNGPVTAPGTTTPPMGTTTAPTRPTTPTPPTTTTPEAPLPDADGDMTSDDRMDGSVADPVDDGTAGAMTPGTSQTR